MAKYQDLCFGDNYLLSDLEIFSFFLFPPLYLGNTIELPKVFKQAHKWMVSIELSVKLGGQIWNRIS